MRGAWELHSSNGGLAASWLLSRAYLLPAVSCRVPSSQLGRALGFAGMGASLLLGSLSDSISRSLGGGGDAAAAGGSGGSRNVYGAFITESNAERLAAALCRMRGAALKIGQMLSIQDESVLPPQVGRLGTHRLGWQHTILSWHTAGADFCCCHACGAARSHPQIQSALERVRAGADVMPRGQLSGQLSSQLGPDWQGRLAHFEWTPAAAASIGQVHAAVLHDGRRVAMKVQYPGVARSIESDVDNLMRLIRVANVLPKGMYVENAVKVRARPARGAPPARDVHYAAAACWHAPCRRPADWCMLRPRRPGCQARAGAGV